MSGIGFAADGKTEVLPETGMVTDNFVDDGVFPLEVCGKALEF